MSIARSMAAALCLLAGAAAVSAGSAEASHLRRVEQPQFGGDLLSLLLGGVDMQTLLNWRRANQPTVDSLLEVIALTRDLDEVSEQFLTGRIAKVEAQQAGAQILQAASSELGEAVRKLNALQPPKMTEKASQETVARFMSSVRLLKTKADELLRASASLYSKAITGAKVLPALRHQQLTRVHVALEMDRVGRKPATTGARTPEDYLDQCEQSASDGLTAVIDFMRRKARAPAQPQEAAAVRQRVQTSLQAIRAAVQRGTQLLPTPEQLAKVQQAKSGIEKTMADLEVANVESFKRSFAVEQSIAESLSSLSADALSDQPLESVWIDVDIALSQLDHAMTARNALAAERFQRSMEFMKKLFSNLPTK